MSGNVTINTNFANGKIGHLIVDGKATKLDAATTSLTISIHDKEDLPVTDQKYALFVTTNGGEVNNITVTNINKNNNFIKWSQDEM